MGLMQASIGFRGLGPLLNWHILALSVKLLPLPFVDRCWTDVGMDPFLGQYSLFAPASVKASSSVLETSHELDVWLIISVDQWLFDVDVC